MRKTTGISLMLLIFLSLCLMTFALLSLSGARADERLSQKAADRTTEYYAAVTEGNRLLSLIDEQLAFCLTEAQSADDPKAAYLEAVGTINDRIPGVTWINADTKPDTEDPADSNEQPAPADLADSHNQASPADTADSAAETLTTVPLAFSIPITDGQILLAELEIHYPETDHDTMYRITAWQVVNTEEWTPDTSQKLFRLTETD